MATHYVRSPELMQVHDTAVVVIDVQEKLLPHIVNHEQIESNIGRLMDGAKAAGIPVVRTEQYPKGLGPTVASLASRAELSMEKLSFSCVESDLFRAKLVELSRRKTLLCGLETHVCVQQTAFDLMAAGYQVYVAVDAVGSRRELDKDVAIRRMADHGVAVCSTESSLFEWCQEAGTDLFKEIRRLVV